MANDPISEIQALQSAYDSLYAAATTLASEVAAAQPTPTSDFTTADVQAALAAFQSDVASKPAPSTRASTTPTTTTPASTSPPATS